MKKCSSLWFMTQAYQLSCEASLRSDMAKRIMYSILPSVANSSQVAITGGVVDYKALQSAIEGRHDIIKYGVRACTQELKHYKKNGPAKQELGSKLIASGDYEQAINLTLQCFADTSGWGGGYGGKAWEKIATSIKKLISYDQALKTMRASKDKNMDQELQVMQQIVIELNIFDGLSHNNSSVMKNLIEQEWKEMPSGNDAAKIQELNAITKMMDSKELSNPIDVFKEIEDTLVGSGDINRYKDWTRKIHNLPEYRATNPHKEEEMFRTRCRKIVGPYISRINTNGDALKSEVQSLEPSLSTITTGGMLPAESYTRIGTLLASIRGNITQAILNLQAFKDTDKERTLTISSITSNLAKVKDKLALELSGFERAWSAAAEADKLGNDRKLHLLGAAKRLSSAVSNVSYFLDSI